MVYDETESRNCKFLISTLVCVVSIGMVLFTMLFYVALTNFVDRKYPGAGAAMAGPQAIMNIQP